jgi:hypothetical protein
MKTFLGEDARGRVEDLGAAGGGGVCRGVEVCCGRHIAPLSLVLNE